VTVKRAKNSFWPLALALTVGLLYAVPAHALRVNISSKGDSDILTFSFDSAELPKSSVRRVGTKELVVTLPDNIWDTETKPGIKESPGKLVQSINVAGNVIRVKTSTNGFGFIRVPSPGKAAFVLQLFRDPIGARWKPRTPKPAPQVAPAPAKTAPTPTAKPVQAPAAKVAPQPVAQPVQKQATPAPVQQPAPATQTAAPAPVKSEADLPPDTAKGERKPFFSVPYSVRNEVSPPGTSAPKGQTPIAPEAVSGVYPPASELRFKVQKKMAEEVKFAELAGSDSGRSPVVGMVKPDEPKPISGSVGGAVEGVVEPLESSGQGAAGGVVAPPPVEVSGAGQAGGSVAPPPGQQVAAAPVEQPDGTVSDVVAPPPAQQSAVSPATEEVSGAGQAGGAVMPPPPSVVQGSPPPAPTPEEAAQIVEPVQEIPAPETTTPEGAVPEQPVEKPVEQDVELAESESEEGAGAEDLAVDNATAEAAAKEQEIKDQLYEAQSMMFNGNLGGALPLFEGILKKPNVPADIREETLYAVADIKKQIFSDDLSGNFEEISQAFIEAMNSNLRSNRVPRSLLNLGLLNLQVGNFPEAKAYFKILQEKYPDDDNIPSISYYWGEYYYKKGDFKKAADQFQYLIQTYPEHQLVKQAAFYLADSLNRTGFVDQAYQIVDYIDKRWPDYYMENMQFLRLAGGVEMKLKKWQEAKNHYFTYYNLNPDADGADIVLARIGDIYIRLGLKKPAKQIYEKAIVNYPDQEGSLVAKMRLAEEGIYDDPSMPQMVSVFDRPYNLQPQNIYSDIVEDYPDSALAPIAQLKLAMWYAFNKKYPEALSAAQDLIEEFPGSPLVDKAKTLGDSVFVLAVPEMVGEERYGRVVRYYETYDFIGKEDSKIDDQTMLSIATSYWKIGQPEKAMAILEPFLQKRQVDKISDEALGIAVNIYLDQLAWKEIADLVGMTKANWKIKPAQQKQLDYARAMSLQNLGDSSQALPMWAELAKDAEVDPAFRAYAMYYMAKDAMQRQDLRRVFVYAQEALTLLLHTKGDPEKIKDTVLMSIYATERSGRYDEALKWAKEYDRYIDADNPEWASTRFKLARIYRKAGAMEEWKQLLGDIIEKKPETLQAKLAKSALDTYELEQQAQQYAPAPQ